MTAYQATVPDHLPNNLAAHPFAKILASRSSVGKVNDERFFRIAAGLDVDKQDLKRYSDFINRKLHDLLVRAEAVAKANGRVVIEPCDLGLQESIHEFENIDKQIVALACAFKVIDGDLKNPATRHWQQCFRIFDLLI
jgi:Domain of unknown function (DUF1931)